jgi:hypothetical protein
MNSLKRLWQRYSDWRIERRGLKGLWVDERKRSQGASPIVGITEEAQLRLLVKRERR